MEELKRWLECHGLKKSGKKEILVERVRHSIGKIKADPKIDGGKWYNLKNNRDSNIIRDQTCFHVSVPQNGWQVFPSRNMPSMFNYGHVYFYLVESVVNMNLPSDARTDGEDFVDCTAKPLKKGRTLLNNGFVENVQDNTTNSGDYVLRGHVHHSMKNLLPLSVTMVISGCSGNIKKALCTCKASSFDRCAHLSALLVYLSDYVSTHSNTVQCPSTSSGISVFFLLVRVN